MRTTETETPKLPNSAFNSALGHSDLLAKIESETIAAVQRDFEDLATQIMGATQELRARTVPSGGRSAKDSQTLKTRQAAAFYESSLYSKLRDCYQVLVKRDRIRGIDVEIFEPMAGVSQDKKNQVLINFHGGGFVHGALINSHLESLPVAALGGFRVVSVDYRLAPEHQYPAATDDVLQVYEAILDEYGSHRIGIFGNSAGALLASQLMVRLLQSNIPLPAALSLNFCGAHYWNLGDSSKMLSTVSGLQLSKFESEPYFDDVEINDKEAFPLNSEAFLSSFPPTLLTSATRDFALSSVLRTHSKLVRSGVSSELHVWEGLGHCFSYHPAFSETKDLVNLNSRFMEKHISNE